MRHNWTAADEVKKLAQFLGERTNGRLGLTTYSPGDGMTRYRIGVAFGNDPHDYFADRAVVTADGRAAALSMLQAFFAGANEGNTTR